MRTYSFEALLNRRQELDKFHRILRRYILVSVTIYRKVVSNPNVTTLSARCLCTLGRGRGYAPYQ